MIVTSNYIYLFIYSLFLLFNYFFIILLFIIYLFIFIKLVAYYYCFLYDYYYSIFCLPQQDKGISISAFPNGTTSKFAGLFSTLSLKWLASSREAVNTNF